MTRNVIDWLIVTCIVMLGLTTFILLWPACASPVEGQPPEESDRDHETVALYLARFCVNEAGFNSPRDCGAIHQVLRNTARDDEGLLAAMSRHTKGRLFVVGGPGRNGQTVRAWTRGLHIGDEPPYRWPAHLDWTNDYRHRFAEVYALSIRIVSGRMGRGPCRSFPIAWGGPMDDAIALRRGLVRVSCGDTINHYWERP